MANYVIFGTDHLDDIKLIECETPKKAIKNWIALQKDYPTCVDIRTEDQYQAQRLYKYLNNNIVEVGFAVERHTGYTFDFVVEANHTVHNRGLDNIDLENNGLYPFTMG